MDDQLRIERQKEMYRKLSDRSGAVGRIPDSTRPNSGRDHKPFKVLEWFRLLHKRHQPVQDKAVSMFGGDSKT
jgi:hypothetical protein